MQSEWFEVQFYSYIDHGWVPLFGRCGTQKEAEAKAGKLLAKWRVVKVTQTKEVVGDDGVSEVSGRDEGGRLRVR